MPRVAFDESDDLIEIAEPYLHGLRRAFARFGDAQSQRALALGGIGINAASGEIVAHAGRVHR
jgi:hypothetical protein